MLEEQEILQKLIAAKRANVRVEPRIDYQEWLDRFPHIASAPLVERHTRLWEWVSSITPNETPAPIVELWNRGGGKTTTVQLAIAYLGKYLQRRFCLYVSGTQEQVDKHVDGTREMFEKLGIKGLTTQTGHSRGWRHNEFRTANGFNVVGIGLDSSSRGIKLDQFRPDFIVMDDIDDREDTAATVEKKIRAITQSILPSRANTGCAVLFVQNLIHEDSIASKLADGTADFLRTAKVSPVEVAVKDLQYETVFDADIGKNVFKITAGTATWSGQDLNRCETDLNDLGESAFKRECQQEVHAASGFFFNEKMFGSCEESALPRLLRLCRAFDFAGTEGGGDYTASPMGGIGPNKRLYIRACEHAQFSSDNVRKMMLRVAVEDFEWALKEYPPVAGKSFPSVTMTWHIPQDPAQAGKDQSAMMHQFIKSPDWDSAAMRTFLIDLGLAREKVQKALGWITVVLKTVSGRGSKAKRAREYSSAVNLGNVVLVSPDGLNASWISPFKVEHRKFREDEKHEYDDQVDGGADLFNELFIVTDFNNAIETLKRLTEMAKSA